MLRSAVILLCLWLSAGAACAQATAPTSRFDGWASAVVAADWRTSAGQPIQAFDNARRDLVAGFLAAGFSRADMVDYTLRPDVEDPTTAIEAATGIGQATARATRGCLLYFTSHGGPQAMVFGPDQLVTPTTLATLVRGWCQDRPTVVVVSACYSGIFVDALSGPNRMVLTAARRDRSSFGCSEDATYPYFDACVIASLPTATDFIALAHATRACVKAREEAEGLTPASEPQLSIGAHMQLLAPTLRFERPPS
ncbi:MAG: C13 family peptidase [Alphaproteobacteria bacterium]|nr:C13 family peptidase [Alphaproteobacteria bacterium]